MLSSLPHVLIIFIAFGGIVLASYIYRKKKSQKVLVCPLKANCDTVVHSEYSRFFGVPVELLGIFYYAVVAVSYAILLIFPSLESSLAAFALFFATAGAFLFSVYLTFIQAFTLRQWCSWCLISAAGSTTIFVLVLIGSLEALTPMFADTKRFLIAMHLIGLALGLGGATISDMFFFRFLRDFKISGEEERTLSMMSQTIWLGLAILVVSGFAIFLSDVESYGQSSKFLTKMVVVGVILINGAFLNLYVSPRLLTISFGQPHHHRAGELRRDRRIAFALGAISFTSWYTAFGLGMARSIPIEISQALIVYGGLLIVAIIGSQILEKIISRRATLDNGALK